MERKIKKLLVANRGEIALRIMRSAREAGIATVAVYSEADRNALHVRFADEAFCIGPPPSSQSYLNADKIIQVALENQVDAIHPGYGFLSENASFSKKVSDAGLLFIGPSPESIETMGSKLAAKEAALKFNIPMVPGGNKAIENLDEAIRIAGEVGYPVLIKASAGGGGKGMRIVHEESEIKEQMERAMSEALASFGDSSVFIEKYISSPKHIEIQIMGDKHGNVVYLFERECSVQRRYQKVVEEAPSPVISPEIRAAMGKAATDVARACNYYGAGTVEFILDENRNFYFLEMNTRLQVEHPVTEMITGKDLVKEQIRVAEGHPLSFSQDSLSISGHAIELRVYAEDPENNFLPDIGTLRNYVTPKGPGIRVDDAFEKGMEIPVYYDPMIAKLIAWGENRDEAIKRLIRAIDEYQITGLATTLKFGKFVLQHEQFTSGKFDTHFVKNFFKPEYLRDKVDHENQGQIAAAIAGILFERKNTQGKVTGTNKGSNWKLRKRI